jgi:hypothetical protein
MDALFVSDLFGWCGDKKATIQGCSIRRTLAPTMIHPPACAFGMKLPRYSCEKLPDPPGARSRMSADQRTASPPVPSRHWRRIACFHAVVLLGIIGVQGVRARSLMLDGASHLRAAESLVHASGYLGHARTQSEARGEVARANGDFAGAQHALWPWSAGMRHLGWIPRVGILLAATPAVADAGEQGSASLLSLLDGAGYILPALNAPTAGPVLPRLLPGLTRAKRDFAQARSESQAATSSVAGIPPRTGSVAVDGTIDQLLAGLHLLDVATSWLVVAPHLLGASGPANYLIAWQDPREQRAAGGYIGAATFVTVNRGVIQVHPGSASKFVKEHHVLLPLPEATYTNEGFFQFCDSNWSPSFPLSARLERWTYGEDTGRWASTVLDVVGAAAAHLLDATGPIYLPSYHQWVDSRNAEAVAQHYIYGSYRGIFDAQHDAQRKQFLGTFMKPFLQKLSRLRAADVPKLARDLSEVIGQQELLMYDRRPTVETAIARSNADGSIARPLGDHVYVVDDNRSYNKLAPYVDESARYDVTINPDMSLRVTLALTYHVRPAPPNLEAAGAYFGLLGGTHDYQDFLRVYVPRGAILGSTSGMTRWAPEHAYGLTQFAGRILVPEGQTRTAVFRYRLPANTLASVQGPAYQLNVQRQPEARLSSFAVTVHGMGGVSLGARHVTRPVQARLSLDHPLTGFRFPVSGTGSPRTVALPSYTNSDPYIPYADLHDARHPF